MSASNERGEQGPNWGPRGNAHWDNLAERRLDDLLTQLRDMRQDIGRVWEELRKEVRAGDNREALIKRLDERLVEVVRRVEEMRDEGTERHEAVRKGFVSKEEFEPVKKAVFTMIGAICLAVLAAVARMVMK